MASKSLFQFLWINVNKKVDSEAAINTQGTQRRDAVRHSYLKSLIAHNRQLLSVLFPGH